MPVLVKMGNWFFKNRGWLGAPFFLIALVFAKFHSILFGVGLVLVLIGEIVRWLSVAFSGPTTRSRQVEAPKLAVDGPYAWVRNPIYWGNFLIGLGMTVSSGALWPWLVGVFTVAFWVEYTLIVLAEESYLGSRFGQEYHEYKNKTHRWLILPRKTSWTGASWLQGLRLEKSTLMVISVYYTALAARMLWEVLGAN